MNILDIFKTDILPGNKTPEYEILHSEVFATHIYWTYRRGLVPNEHTLLAGGRFTIPMLPLMKKGNGEAEMKQAVGSFFSDCAGRIDKPIFGLRKGLNCGKAHISEYHSKIGCVLHGRDITKREIGKVWNGPSYSLPEDSRTVIVVPEPMVAGVLAINKTGGTKYGICLFKNNIFIFEAD